MNRRLFIDGVYMITGVLTIEYIFNRVIIEDEEEEGDDCIIS